MGFPVSLIDVVLIGLVAAAGAIAAAAGGPVVLGLGAVLIVLCAVTLVWSDELPCDESQHFHGNADR